MKEKKYISDIPELMKEWDYEANELDPSKLTIGSGQKVWWICSKGHKWLAEIRDRISRNSKCPYCYGRKVLTGFSDLATTHPELAKEWNHKKNKALLPSQVKAGSNQKVWWKCSKGHEWFAKIGLRTYLKSKCPYCNHHTVLSGFNDLATTNPELAKEWNYKKNAPLLPTQVFGRSAKKVWWICPRGHEYKTAISNRKISGCPICSKEQQTSFPEQAIFYYLLKYNKNTVNRYLVYGIECDIYLKDLNVSIEYDSGYYHKNTKKDINKIKKLNELGIKTINIRDYRCPKIEVDSALIYQRENETSKDLEKAIEFIFSSIDDALRPDINLERDRNIILQNALSIEKKNSLANLNPTFLKEWNYERNGTLKPEFFSSFSGKKVWWKCSEGHEWQAAINNRRAGNNCPYCGHQKLLQGYNDLETVHPKLTKEWNYEKNFPLTPKDYITGSNKKVWWKCSKGHEWKSYISNRCKGNKCPVCSNQKLLTGYNDLETVHPELAKEWNYEKNNPLLPTKFIAGSKRKVWWKCKKGHEWKTSLNARQNGTGCPYCANNKVLVGYNDLATLNPELAKEWNYEKNAPLLPTQVVAKSIKKVWWKCKKGHEWCAVIANRNKGIGCPICSHRQILEGYNDLATTNPEIAKEWNYERNHPLLPTQVAAGGKKKVWWICKKGHEWLAALYSRKAGFNCPKCAREKARVKHKNKNQLELDLKSK